MYTKDLSFLLRLLQTSRQSGILFVEAATPNASLPWQGKFQIESGVVRSCAVFNRQNGKVLFTNDQAISWLILQGRLVWHIEEEDQSSNSMQSSPTFDEKRRGGYKEEESILLSPIWEKRRKEVFTRTQRGDRSPVNAFPSRDHRQVFALVDGRRSIEEIVRLLQKPPEAILKLLQELQNAGFIV
jgi:hypothetical protein